jgi:hypothetical protein
VCKFNGKTITELRKIFKGGKITGHLHYEGKGVRNDDGPGEGRRLVKNTKIPFAQRVMSKSWKKNKTETLFIDNGELMTKLEKLLGLGRIIQTGILATKKKGADQLLHRDISIKESNHHEIIVWNINLSKKYKSKIIIGEKTIEMDLCEGVWFNSMLMHAGDHFFNIWLQKNNKTHN